MSSFFDSEPGAALRTEDDTEGRDRAERASRPGAEVDPAEGWANAGPDRSDTDRSDADRSDTDADGTDGDDEDFIPKPPFRLSAVSIALIGLIILGGGFLTGVLVQKHHDKGTSPAAGRFGTRGGGFAAGAEGFPAGGFGGEGFPASGLGGGHGAGSGSGGGTSNSGATSDATPAVIGTLTSVSGSTLVVKNLGGKSVRVTVPKTATVTVPYGSALKKGDSVSVVGSTSGGTVTATSITVTG